MTGGGQSLAQDGVGRAGPPVWDSVQLWCSRALTHGLGPPGLWGSEDIFSMESSLWRSADGGSLPPPTAGRALPSRLSCRTFRGLGWELGAPGRGQSGGPAAGQSRKALPCVTSGLGGGRDDERQGLAAGRRT